MLSLCETDVRLFSEQSTQIPDLANPSVSKFPQVLPLKQLPPEDLVEFDPVSTGQPNEFVARCRAKKGVKGAVSSAQKNAPALGKQVRAGARFRLAPHGLGQEQHLKESVKVTHPVDRPSLTDSTLQGVIDRQKSMSPEEIQAERRSIQAWVIDKAEELKAENEKIIAAAPAECQKILKRKGKRPVNVALLRHLSKLVDHVDSEYAEQFPQGFKITGVIPKSGPWPSIPSGKAKERKITVSEWELRREMLNQELQSRCKPSGKSEVDSDLWAATRKDIDHGFCAGPFFSEEEVSQHLGTKSWIRAPRFPCLQPRPKFVESEDGKRRLVMASKTRAIDDDAANQVNDTAILQEALTLVTTDDVASYIRYCKEFFGQDAQMAGFALDQAGAYRTVPLAPEDRRFQVTSVWNPEFEKEVFTCLYSHAFGASASVPNFCRLSALIERIVRVVGRVPSMHYIDDHWAIERESTIQSAHGTMRVIFRELGFPVEESKDQIGKTHRATRSRIRFVEKDRGSTSNRH